MTEVSIDELGMSVRSTNALHRAGIFNVEQLIKLSDEDLYNISNMGAKSVTEVRDAIWKIRNGEILISEDVGTGKRIIITELEKSECITENDILVAWAHNKKVISLEHVSFLKSGDIVEDLYIDEISFSNRSYNAMSKNGLVRLSSICQMTMKELLEVKYLGKKSIDEIIEKIALYTAIEEDADSFGAEQCLATVLERFEGMEYKTEMASIKLHIKKALSTEEVLGYVAIYERTPEACIADIIQIVMKDSFFVDLFQVHLLNKIVDMNEATVKDFIEIFPYEFMDYCSDIIQMLIDRKKIIYSEGKYEIAYKSFKEWIETLEDGREKTFIERKAKGQTLEEIGEDYGITRERVRQVIAKQIKKCPRLREDKFTWLFEKYALDKEKVMYIFNFDEYAYEYYCIVTKKAGQEDYLGILKEDVPLYVKSNLEAYRYKDCIDVDGEKVEKNRNSILQYILRNKCRDEIPLAEVKQLFDKFLYEYDLLDDEIYQYPERYLETKLANKSDVLWKHGKKLRYFVMSEEDFDELLKDIHFDELQDVEISTRYFFQNYPDIMELYDIRDANELHNLMKKHMSDTEIDFNRMPHIGIGNYDRDMQVLNLLLEYAPIHYEELGKLYEEQYGVEAKTAVAVHFMCISEYVHNGIYSIDYDELTKEEYDALIDILKDDLYELSAVKKTFIQRVPDGDIAKLNDYNFKKLGYKISVNLIYKASKYKHIDTYFKENILNKDIIDLNSCEWMMRNQVLYNLIWQMKNEYELIEFAKLKYISIQKLEEQGISKKHIIDFCVSACDFMNGRYFTVHSLKKNGFTHELFELGFDEYFYVSLLRYFPGCNYVRVGTRVNALFHEEGQADVRELLQNIIIKNGCIDIYDLLDYLNDEYGIITDKWKLISWVKEANLYYSETMEKVYLDYDQFYEEV